MFAIWIKAGKDSANSLALVESLAAGEYDTLSEGGARIVSANVAGKQFNYELPDGWSSTDFIANLRQLYKLLTTCGANGLMTDDELESYVVDSGNQVTSVSKARFADYAGRRI